MLNPVSSVTNKPGPLMFIARTSRVYLFQFKATWRYTSLKVLDTYWNPHSFLLGHSVNCFCSAENNPGHLTLFPEPQSFIFLLIKDNRLTTHFEVLDTYGNRHAFVLGRLVNVKSCFICNKQTWTFDLYC